MKTKPEKDFVMMVDNTQRGGATMRIVRTARLFPEELVGYEYVRDQNPDAELWTKNVNATSIKKDIADHFGVDE